MICPICKREIHGSYLCSRTLCCVGDEGKKIYLDTNYHEQCYVEEWLEILKGKQVGVML